jgi:hypothetical protein
MAMVLMAGSDVHLSLWNALDEDSGPSPQVEATVKDVFRAVLPLAAEVVSMHAIIEKVRANKSPLGLAVYAFWLHKMKSDSFATDDRKLNAVIVNKVWKQIRNRKVVKKELRRRAAVTGAPNGEVLKAYQKYLRSSVPRSFRSLLKSVQRTERIKARLVAAVSEMLDLAVGTR